jgi:hypothetical protein
MSNSCPKDLPRLTYRRRSWGASRGLPCSRFLGSSYLGHGGRVRAPKRRRRKTSSTRVIGYWSLFSCPPGHAGASLVRYFPPATSPARPPRRPSRNSHRQPSRGSPTVSAQDPARWRPQGRWCVILCWRQERSAAVALPLCRTGPCSPESFCGQINKVFMQPCWLAVDVLDDNTDRLTYGRALRKADVGIKANSGIDNCLRKFLAESPPDCPNCRQLTPGIPA